jgi:hypothetical protein
MLWCAPFFMGRYVQRREAMAPYCVWNGTKRETILCPFCKESRQHAHDTAARLMRDFELGGLKFDFMDLVHECRDPKHDHGDGNYGAAAIEFMKAARDGVLSMKSDAAIEYRIRYSTLATLPFANCHRGNDSPYDADYMRRENLFLRLFCDYPSAIWNDYAYWHADERPENASLMMAEQVFSGGVPTLSFNLATMSAEHHSIIRRWLAFYHEHRITLAKATLTVHSADSCLSVSSLQNREQGIAYGLIAGQHVPARIELAAGTGPMPIVRGATPATAPATIRARGAIPAFSPASPLPTSRAAAPSFTPDALPAVTTPPSVRGLSFPSVSNVVSDRGCSSLSTGAVAFFFRS